MTTETKEHPLPHQRTDQLATSIDAIPVTIHPDNPGGRDRNHDIVDACGHLCAASPTPHEIEGSGTWETIRYARQIGRRITIIWPDGSTTEEGR